MPITNDGLRRDFINQKKSSSIAKVNKLSESLISSNVKWLLHSGIRIKSGSDKGALYGWKYLNLNTYPFVYSEITGYAVTVYSWIFSELGIPEALRAAKDAARWIIRKLNSEFLLIAGYTKQNTFSEKGDISNQIYLFDNGMSMIGLLNLYQITKKQDLLKFAIKMSDSMIKYFFDGSTIATALVDRFYRPVELKEEKWSAIPGVYHSKLSLGLLELSKLTGNTNYSRISNAICDFALSMQKPDGRFETFPGSKITYLHPHLYACEGLLYSGITLSKREHLMSAMKGILWAVRQLKETGGLPRNNSNDSVEQSDAMCQLLRLIIICYSDLGKEINGSSLANIINKLHQRIFNYCIISDNDNRGGIKYQLHLDTTCSWCTMFCVQALSLWQKKFDGEDSLNGVKWMNYFV